MGGNQNQRPFGDTTKVAMALSTQRILNVSTKQIRVESFWKFWKLSLPTTRNRQLMTKMSLELASCG